MTPIPFVTTLVTVMAANSQFAVAVHILAMLAKSGEENVKSDCIAASVNTNADWGSSEPITVTQNDIEMAASKYGLVMPNCI